MKRFKHYLSFLLLLVLIIVMPKEASASTFKDTKGHWADQYINWAYKQGFIKGYKDGSFRADAPLMRAELFTIINSLYDSQSTSTDLWPQKEVEKIKKSQLAYDYFNIYDYKTRLIPATRIEAVQLLAAVYNFYTDNDLSTITLNESLDAPSGSMEYSEQDIKIMLKMSKETNVMGGFPDGTFKPYASLTRAQFCKMLYSAAKWRFHGGDVKVQNDSTWQDRVVSILKNKLNSGRVNCYIASTRKELEGGYNLMDLALNRLNDPLYDSTKSIIARGGNTKIYSYYTSNSENQLFFYEMSRKRREGKDYLQNWYQKVYDGYTADMLKDYEKAKYIHDTIIKNAHYIDFDVVKYGSLQAVYKYGNNDFQKPISIAKGTGSVCEAYAQAFKDLCDKFQIECIYVSGKTIEGVGHAWNKVKIDGTWYNVDCTWDDPRVIGNTSNISGHEKDENFLRSDSFIAKTRLQDEEFNGYPAPSDY